MKQQKGFILVVSLIFMAVMSVLAIYMFSGFTTDAMLSANSREKSRSLDAAQSALDYALLWLSTDTNTNIGTLTGGACTGTGTTPCIFTQVLASASNTTANDPSTWTVYTTFTPSVMSGHVVSGGGAANTYNTKPNYYMQYVGTGIGANAGAALYQVTASAQGGNLTATSVVQAVYAVKPNSYVPGQ